MFLHLHEMTIIIWTKEMHAFEGSILKLSSFFCCGADIYLHSYPVYITVDFPWTVHRLKLGDYGRHFLYFPDLCASSLKNKKQNNRLGNLKSNFLHSRKWLMSPSDLLKLHLFSITFSSKMTTQPHPAQLGYSICKKKVRVRKKEMEW